jgi:hypothetical protein
MQTKTGSAVEVAVYTVLSFTSSVGVSQLWLYPTFGVELQLLDNLGLTAILVIISMILKYGCRRLFNSLKMFREEE